MKGNVKMSYKWTITDYTTPIPTHPFYKFEWDKSGWYDKLEKKDDLNEEMSKDRFDKLVKMFGNSSSKLNSFTPKGYGIISHEEFEEEGNSGVRLVFTLPGADKKDIKVRRDQGDIVVSYDNFTHTTELDFVGEVSPKYKNGLLTVDIFYPEDVKPQDFTVK